MPSELTVVRMVPGTYHVSGWKPDGREMQPCVMHYGDSAEFKFDEDDSLVLNAGGEPTLVRFAWWLYHRLIVRARTIRYQFQKR
jgi:hypothetical protein